MPFSPHSFLSPVSCISVLEILRGDEDSIDSEELQQQTLSYHEAEPWSTSHLNQSPEESQSEQILLEEDVDVVADGDEVVEEDLDYDVIKNLILKLGKAVACEEMPYWDYCEEEVEEEEDLCGSGVYSLN